MSDKILQVRNLSVNFKTHNSVVEAVKNISFSINKGETVALVGESGSGKSVTALSIIQLLPYPVASHSDETRILFHDMDILSAPPKELRRIRGEKIGMIFQEPMTSLNPLHSVERQISEVVQYHNKIDKEDARAKTLELIELVGLSELKDRLNAYPYELSGGQRQRVMIAIALANAPELLIADEPTTALDVTVQAQILELLDDLKTRLNMSLLLITHDLGIVEKMADHICVMKDGEIVETRTKKGLFEAPKHPYTKMLLSSRPQNLTKELNKDAAVILSAKNLKIHFPKKKNLFGKPTTWVKAVDGISLVCRKGQTLGVVGESGSGKSTLGFGLLRLLKPTDGTIDYLGQNIADTSKIELRNLRQSMQVVFQDPFSSLSPRMSIAGIIGEGLQVHKKHLSKAERRDLIDKTLLDVGLHPDMRNRYPHEFSGGQRQRVSVARAMVLKPDFIVLDEPTSALDVSVQAQIVELLQRLQEEHSLSYMFISHDLRVVRAMSHELLVMRHGKVVETGTAKEIFNNPKQDYTQNLLEASLNLKLKNQRA